MTTQKKIDKVTQLKETIAAAKGAYLADYQGMDVGMATELRNRCRDAGVRFEVVKNTLTLRALDDDIRSDLEPYLQGPTALATSETDEIAAAKVLAEFMKEFKKPVLKAGLVDGRVVGDDKVMVLAKLPGKDVLLGMLVGGLKSPLQKLHGALSSPLRNLASVLKQTAEQKS